ncbi:hypothetical protein Ndes2526B_g02753 [Nannochloris sp. 'desiccata']
MMTPLNIHLGSVSTLRRDALQTPHVSLVSTTSRVQRSLAVLPRRTSLRMVAFAAPTSFPNPLREDGGVQFSQDTPSPVLKPLPRKVEGLVDDPRLHNPLQRLERLGTGWMGVILELEGVCVDYEYGDVATRSWQQLADEEGKPAPPIWALKKAEGMKNEQIIQEVFCWTRNPVEARRLNVRKEEILASLLGDRKPMISSGVPTFLDILERTGAPVAVVSSAPEFRVNSTIENSGLAPRFEVVISGDDMYRGKPDPEGYLYAAQRIDRPPVRCVVVGTSNLSVEAAHEVGMKCVAVAGRNPVYELSAADLVVRSLEQLSFINLKQLFAMEENAMAHNDDDDENGGGEFMTEEDEEDYGGRGTTVQVMERERF